MNKHICFLIVLSLSVFASHAQTDKPKAKKEKFNKEIFKDSLDGKLDFSDFLIDFDGFIPVVNIITEPALGGFGGMFSPVFIQKNKYKIPGEYTPPTITTAMAGYSANKSWFTGLFRVASLPQYKLKYRAGAIYSDINMDYYRTLPVVGEQSFEFNIRSAGAFLSVMRQIGKGDWYAGLEYAYFHNELRPDFDNDRLEDIAQEHDLNSNISNLGVNVEFDNRDSMFTPDKGMQIYSEFQSSSDFIGSDYNFQNWNTSIFKYIPFASNWVGGFRFQSKLQFGDAPFYIEPGINLRGVPMSRYQGDQSYVLETEQRFDITTRWSLVGFTGIAKAIPEDMTFKDAELVYNYGTGFRYLIARKFKIRTGVDFAWSNHDFGWYIVFGSAWNIRN